jgi:hypothetical protein
MMIVDYDEATKLYRVRYDGEWNHPRHDQWRPAGDITGDLVANYHENKVIWDEFTATIAAAPTCTDPKKRSGYWTIMERIGRRLLELLAQAGVEEGTIRTCEAFIETCSSTYPTPDDHKEPREKGRKGGRKSSSNAGFILRRG